MTHRENSMEPRINYTKIAGGGVHAMLRLEKYLHSCGLEEGLLHLIKLRASQINGCAYCLDMHWKELRAIGEREQRMYSLHQCVESAVHRRSHDAGHRQRLTSDRRVPFR